MVEKQMKRPDGRRKTHGRTFMSRFAKKVYAIVRRVPRGKIITYKAVAVLAGKPKAARAVGTVMAKNPYAFGSKAARRNWVPCHRVIKSNGELGGFMGGYTHCSKKQDLLHQEGIEVKGKKIVDFRKHLARK